MLLCVFSQLKFKKVGAKIIGLFAPFTFGVYLAHTQKCVWEYVLKDLFIEFSTYSALESVVAVLLAAVGMYMASMLIELLRYAFFRLLRVKERLQRLEDKLLKNFWNKT